MRVAAAISEYRTPASPSQIVAPAVAPTMLMTLGLTSWTVNEAACSRFGTHSVAVRPYPETVSVSAAAGSVAAIGIAGIPTIRRESRTRARLRSGCGMIEIAGVS